MIPLTQRAARSRPRRASSSARALDRAARRRRAPRAGSRSRRPSAPELPWPTTATPRSPSRIAPPVVSGSICAAQPAERRAQQQPAGGGDRARARGVADRARDRLRRPLERLQGDVAGEPVGDDHVGVAREQVAALDVAAEVELPAPSPASAACASTTSRRSLLRLLADREQDHPRALDPEHGAAERGAEIGELDQVAGRAPRRSRRRRAAAPGARRGRGRGAARRAPGGGRRWIRFSANRAAVIVAPVGPALASASAPPSATSRGRADDRCLGLARGRRRPARRRWRSHSAASTSSTPVDAVEPAELGGIAEDAHGDAVGRGGTGAGDDRLGAPVGAAAVEGDRGHRSRWRLGYAAEPGSSSPISCAITSRPA